MNSRETDAGESTSRVFVSSRHRTDVEVIYDFLNAIGHGMQTKMRLMFSTYLHSGQIDKTLSPLVAKELISEKHPGVYHITKKNHCPGSISSTS